MKTSTNSETKMFAYHDDERMMTVRETMTLLGLSRTYIHNLVQDGKLNPMRLQRGIRFRRGDVLGYRDAQMKCPDKGA